MYISSCSVLLYAGLVLLVYRVNSQRIVLRSGRHVCQQQKRVMVPIARTKTVCTPYYQRSYRPCQKPQRGLCPAYRLMYRTDYRRVIEMVPRVQTYFTCCPGWSGYDVTYNTCRRPVCNPECQHKGSCLQPNRCVCPGGWNGTNCQSDIDECSSSPCDQKCFNTGGSFRCDCYQGYRLAEDGHTCTLCLSCTDEFTSILQDQKELRRTIVKLEEHNTVMMRNLSTLHQDLEALNSMPILTTPPVTTPPQEKEEGPNVEDLSDELDAYMSSISEQIAMLEERLDVCTCKRQGLETRARTVKLSPRLNPNNWVFSNARRHHELNKHKKRVSTTPRTPKSTTTTEQSFLLVKLPTK